MTQTSAPAWLAVDVGNSRVKAGLFVRQTGSGVRELPNCRVHYDTSLDDGLPWHELNAVGTRLEFRGVVVGSNQQGVDRVAAEWSERFAQELVVIRTSNRFPLTVDVDNPEKVGLDRLLNAVAVNADRESQRAIIVVDCGTATTVDLVTADGIFRGGAILPGFALQAKALHHYTEVLPLISIEQVAAIDPETDGHPALGRDTQAAIMSGIFWGQVGAIRELINSLSAPLDTPFDIVLTGGGSQLLVPHFPNATHAPFLPLQGLIVAAESAE